MYAGSVGNSDLNVLNRGREPTTSSVFGRSMQAIKSAGNKTLEVAKTILNSLGHFLCGFCLGAGAATFYMLVNEPIAICCLDLRVLAVVAIGAGLISGFALAYNMWQN